MRAIIRLVITVVMVFQPLALRAQDPVIKPVTRPPVSSSVRLPAPATMVATQESQRTIRVVWSSVRGATGYRLVRSVPPVPATVISPNPTDTVFIDSDITIGSTYNYMVSAINDAGIAGLNRGSNAVKATTIIAPRDSTPTAPTGARVLGAPLNLVATFRSPDTVSLRWGNGGQENISWLVDRKAVSDPTGQWFRVTNTGQFGKSASPTSGVDMSVSWIPQGTRMVWRVTARDVNDFRETGPVSPPAISNELQISQRTATLRPTTFTVYIGKTVSINSALSGTSEPHWQALDESIATVDASGTVTSKALGTARFINLAPTAGSSMVVTLVEVVVDNALRAPETPLPQ